MAVLEAPERHQDLIDELIAEVAEYNPDVDRDLLVRAFRFSSKAHADQQRRSGEEFILHPYAVARICAELQLDDETIAAALLHDVVEDTGVTLEELAEEFGEGVAQLVDGVTKLTRVHFQKAGEALEVYAPLAHRLGTHTMKWQLEDFAFETLHARKYTEIKAMVNE